MWPPGQTGAAVQPLSLPGGFRHPQIRGGGLLPGDTGVPFHGRKPAVSPTGWGRGFTRMGTRLGRGDLDGVFTGASHAAGASRQTSFPRPFSAAASAPFRPAGPSDSDSDWDSISDSDWIGLGADLVSGAVSILFCFAS